MRFALFVNTFWGEFWKLLANAIRSIIWGMTEVQELITQLRAKGWTVAAISEELGVDYYTVYKWEKGIHEPSNAGAVLRVLRQLLQQRRIPKRRRVKRNPSASKD
jgi:hypothetical protein